MLPIRKAHIYTGDVDSRPSNMDLGALTIDQASWFYAVIFYGCFLYTEADPVPFPAIADASGDRN